MTKPTKQQIERGAKAFYEQPWTDMGGFPETVWSELAQASKSAYLKQAKACLTAAGLTTEERKAADELAEALEAYGAGDEWDAVTDALRAYHSATQGEARESGEADCAESCRKHLTCRDKEATLPRRDLFSPVGMTTDNDCVRACVASVTGLPVDSLPNPWDKGEGEWFRVWQRALRRQGWIIECWPDLPVCRRFQEGGRHEVCLAPEGLWIALVPSLNISPTKECPKPSHAIVMDGAEILHDPTRETKRTGWGTDNDVLEILVLTRLTDSANEPRGECLANPDPAPTQSGTEKDCPECGGAWWIGQDGSAYCPKCHGTGKVPESGQPDIHTCHEHCPCHEGRKPRSDFLESGPTPACPAECDEGYVWEEMRGVVPCPTCHPDKEER